MQRPLFASCEFLGTFLPNSLWWGSISLNDRHFFFPVGILCSFQLNDNFSLQKSSAKSRLKHLCVTAASKRCQTQPRILSLNWLHLLSWKKRRKQHLLNAYHGSENSYAFFSHVILGGRHYHLYFRDETVGTWKCYLAWPRSLISEWWI